MQTWVVGLEYDDAAFARLGKALSSLGFRIDQESWGVVGSQEMSVWDARSKKGALRIEAETFIGLSVTGPRMLVDVVKNRFESPTAEDSGD